MIAASLARDETLTKIIFGEGNGTLSIGNRPVHCDRAFAAIDLEMVFSRFEACDGRASGEFAELVLGGNESTARRHLDNGRCPRLGGLITTRDEKSADGDRGREQDRH